MSKGMSKDSPLAKATCENIKEESAVCPSFRYTHVSSLIPFFTLRMLSIIPRSRSPKLNWHVSTVRYAQTRNYLLQLGQVDKGAHRNTRQQVVVQFKEPVGTYIYNPFILHTCLFEFWHERNYLDKHLLRFAHTYIKLNRKLADWDTNTQCRLIATHFERKQGALTSIPADSPRHQLQYSSVRFLKD